MKIKRFISILMTVVLMLSVVFCAIPTASASTTNSDNKITTVRFMATLQGCKSVNNNYKVSRFNDYTINYYLLFDNKKVNINSLSKYIKVKSSEKSVVVNGNMLRVFWGNGKKTQIIAYIKGSKIYDMLTPILSQIPSNIDSNSSSLKNMKNLLESIKTKSVSYRFYVTPYCFKAKVTSVRKLSDGQALVRAKALTPFDTTDFRFFDGKDIEYVGAKKVNSSVYFTFRVVNPKSTKITVLPIGTTHNRDNKSVSKYIIKTFKVIPCKFAKTNYILHS